MRGVGRASGAITIVNALPTGIGSALGISLYAEADVTIRPPEEAVAARSGWLEVSGSPRTPLLEAAVETALRRFGPPTGGSVELVLRSEIPIGRGLKSSSAITSAIGLAVASAAGHRPGATEIATFSADVSRAAGVSATGAFDDAMAGLSPGFVVTDNRRHEVLRRGPADPNWAVALYIPEQPHRPSPELANQFRAAADAGQAAVDAALRGDWWNAMAINSEIVERTMGYRYRDLRQRLRERGALGVGVSGLGPAIAAIGPRSRAERWKEEMPTTGGERRIVPLASDSPEVGR